MIIKDILNNANYFVPQFVPVMKGLCNPGLALGNIFLRPGGLASGYACKKSKKSGGDANNLHSVYMNIPLFSCVPGVAV